MDKVYWKMKNGQQIDVDDMTESHLRNTLKIIIRKSNNGKTKQKTGIDLAFSEQEIEALYNSRYGHDDNYW